MQSRLLRMAGASLRVFAFGALVAGVVGCQSSSDSLVNPLPQSAAPAIDLGGVWSGTLSEEGSDPMAVTWTASQFGEIVEGPLVVATTELGEINATLTGVMTGGGQAVLTVTVEAFPTVPACSAFGSGSSALTETEISANIDVFYSQECIGVLTSEAKESFRLSLSRQPRPIHAERKK